MRQIAMQHIWIEGARIDWAERVEGLRKRMWKYGWGLLFVLVMTVLAEYGPRTLYSKIPPAPPAASQPAVHGIK
jgi:hypothetical protein